MKRNLYQIIFLTLINDAFLLCFLYKPIASLKIMMSGNGVHCGLSLHPLLYSAAVDSQRVLPLCINDKSHNPAMSHSSWCTQHTDTCRMQYYILWLEGKIEGLNAKATYKPTELLQQINTAVTKLQQSMFASLYMYMYTQLSLWSLTAFARQFFSWPLSTWSLDPLMLDCWRTEPRFNNCRTLKFHSLATYHFTATTYW